MLNLLRHVKHGVTQNAARAARSFAEWRTRKHVVGRIFSGPFRQVMFSEAEMIGGLAAKFLGTYELELHPTLERIKRLRPSVALNVGGAEGYYAVGMAAAWGVEKVIVYELAATGRDLIGRNAALNDIGDHLDIRGVCTARELATTLEMEAVQLLIMDVEGAELDILQPDVLRGLTNCVVVIESHDFCRPGCLDELCTRFQGTHIIEIVTSKKRNAESFPYASAMPAFLKRWLMDEARPGPMQWLVGYPRSELVVR